MMSVGTQFCVPPSTENGVSPATATDRPFTTPISRRACWVVMLCELAVTVVDGPGFAMMFCSFMG